MYSKYLYEAHITFDKKYAAEVKNLAEIYNWKYSQIDGDPILGDNTYCYLTTHDGEAGHLVDIIRITLAHDEAPPSVRSKIEMTVYDTAHNVNLIG